MLLLQFYRSGGLDAVLRVCRRYTDAIARISEIKPSERSEIDQQEMVHVYGGLKIALHLLSSLISFKPTSDPGQVCQYISQGKPETHPDYYEPHDFLVKMRLAIAPFIRDIWRSSWLITAPPPVSKYAIQCIQEVIRGENETPRSDFHNTNMLPSSGQEGLLRLSNPPTEDRITQLTDMGFGRAAAIRALTRTQNNVSIATEYLLAHPFDPADEEGADTPQPPQEDQDAQTTNVETSGNAETNADANAGPSADAASSSTSTEESSATTAMDTDEAQPGPSATEEPPVESKGTAEERRKELDSLREDLKSDIAPLSLRLADAHPALIFDVRQAFIEPGTGTLEYQLDAIRSVIRDIQNYSPSAYDIHEEPLAVRCRLLALMLTDSPKDVVESGEGKGVMDMLHAILLSQPIGVDKDQPLPKWLSALLLSMESLIVLSEEPQPAALVLAEQPVTTPKLFAGPPYSEARSTLFELSMRLLQMPSLPRDELLASLRIIVQLTRDHAFAQQFAKRDGVPLLLQRLKSPSSDDSSTPGFQSHIAIILRHLMEDKSVLHSAMKYEINRFFGGLRTRTVDLMSYIRTSQGLAARDPQIFIEATKELCFLARPDVPGYQLTLRTLDDGKTSAPVEKPPGDSTAQMQVDSPVTPTSPSSETLESVLHFMLSELIRVGKSATEDVPAQPTKDTSKSSIAIDADNIPSGPSEPAEANPIEGDSGPKESDAASKAQEAHFYACFLMKCLSELLFSYEQCKLVFLAYPKRQAHIPANKDVFARSKSAALSFLLTEFIAFGPFQAEVKDATRKKEVLCSEAISVIISLCVDSSGARNESTSSPDPTSIRKLVLESTNRAVKDASNIEAVDVRYGKIMGLAELCNKLLSFRIDTRPSKPADDTPMHIAKIMLEKNFVATLTNVLADVDFDYPNIRNVITAVLRPLEFL